MQRATANQDAVVLALGALGWTLAEPVRAERLLALTGLDPQTLRQAAGSPDTLIAVIDFLGAHEPDLIACATALGITPETLIAVRTRLETP